MAKKKSVDVAEEIVLADGAEITLADADEIGEVLAEIEIADAKAEAYAEQPADLTSDGISEEAVVAPSKPKKEPRAPRMSMTSGSKASEIIASSGTSGPLMLTTGGLMLDGDALTAIDKLDKKTREKAVNLVQSIAANKRPSVYTVQAFKALANAGGTLGLKQLTDYYMTECNYKVGTARRQASEMFALFPAFRIATKDGGKGTPLVLSTESVIATWLRKISEPTLA
jgi:hypothetical protein